ncbi:MAG: mechanosensitive ion channel family protein [Proteobacteria bacterium]|nr:mechanosensitive ion channel family protein [Pseudomonadota bacterium]
MDIQASGDFFAQLPGWAQTTLGITILALAIVVATTLIKKLTLKLVERSIHTHARFANDRPLIFLIVRHLTNIFPAVLTSRGIVLVPNLPDDVVTVARNCATAFIVVTIVLALNAALTFANSVYQRGPNAAMRPIKSYLQVIRIVLFACGAILVIAALMEQSPLLLLSGIGALAAVLMLVFKDTILSLVASVQLASNDMLRVGDWIEMPQLNADGDVIDIALHTVKVQNWDMTVTSIPTYRLISESYKNWRGMSESGGRRIKRSLHLDQHSVRFLTRDEITALGRFALLKPYLSAKREELERWNAALSERGLDTLNHRQLTNVGTLRAYVQAYIEWHPRIHRDMTRLVRQLQPTADGLPLEIYCFTSTVEWNEYEAIQADIVDHILAVLPHFDLRLFQRLGGTDIRNLALLLDPPRALGAARAS